MISFPFRFFSFVFFFLSPFCIVYCFIFNPIRIQIGISSFLEMKARRHLKERETWRFNFSVILACILHWFDRFFQNPGNTRLKCSRRFDVRLPSERGRVGSHPSHVP